MRTLQLEIWNGHLLDKILPDKLMKLRLLWDNNQAVDTIHINLQ